VAFFAVHRLEGSGNEEKWMFMLGILGFKDNLARCFKMAADITPPLFPLSTLGSIPQFQSTADENHSNG
jgi:hypothetical protein